jgi:hypothetical protein
MAAGTGHWLCCGEPVNGPHPVPGRTHEMSSYDDLAEQAERQFLADLASAQPDGAAVELAGDGWDRMSTDELLAMDAGYEDFALADAVAATSLEAEAQRQVQDAEQETERRLLPVPSSENRLERALGRLAAGTYTPQGQFAAGQYGDDPADPDDLSGQYLPQNCDISDYFGRCAAAVHEAGCSHNAGNPAGLDVHEIEAWRAAVNRNRGGRPEGLDAGLYETGGGHQGERDAGYHQLAINLGIAGNGTSPEGRTELGARAQAAQALQQTGGTPW